MKGETRFLELEDILELHERQLGHFGGGSGIRDEGLLGSAVAQPQASFGGVFMHTTLEEQAAAYLFHIVSNHPFVDGNKRVGLLASLTFMAINGRPVRRSSEALYDLTIAVAEGALGKEEVTRRFGEIVAGEAL